MASVPPTAFPLVSIVIPSYNHGHYLQEAINSATKQTYPAIEIIVVDDGSTDNTSDIAKRNPEVKYIHQANQGLSSARNTGIAHSTGEYLVFLDADDFLYEDAIATNLDFLEKDQRLAFVSGSYNKVYTKSGKVEPVVRYVTSDHYLYLLKSNYISMHAAVMYRRWIFDYFLYDTTLKACEDYDLYLRIARSYPVHHHTHPIAAYRLHQENMSNNVFLMLTTAHKALGRQKKHLLNIQERCAYAYGRITWQHYYMGVLYERIQEKKQLSKGDFEVLSMYDRSFLFDYLYHQLVGSAIKWGSRHTPAFIKKALRVYGLRK